MKIIQGLLAVVLLYPSVGLSSPASISSIHGKTLIFSDALIMKGKRGPAPVIRKAIVQLEIAKFTFDDNGFKQELICQKTGIANVFDIREGGEPWGIGEIINCDSTYKGEAVELSVTTGVFLYKRLDSKGDTEEVKSFGGNVHIGDKAYVDGGAISYGVDTEKIDLVLNTTSISRDSTSDTQEIFRFYFTFIDKVSP